MNVKSHSHTYRRRFEFEITHDDFIDYLTKLEELFQSERREWVNYLMYEMVGAPVSEEGFIAPYMSKWNPYLRYTGQMAQYWEGEEIDGMTSLTALYTGRDLHKFLGENPPKGVWWEFATKSTMDLPVRERKLARDYAYFQETGRDPVAQPKKARNTGAIAFGISLAAPHLLSETEKYFAQLLQLQKGKRHQYGSITTDDIFG